MDISRTRRTHLKQLEAESIHIFREVVAEFDNPVMLYSVGKASAVMLHLALKADGFSPGKELVDFRELVCRLCPDAWLEWTKSDQHRNTVDKATSCATFRTTKTFSPTGGVIMPISITITATTTIPASGAGMKFVIFGIPQMINIVSATSANMV